MKFKNENIILFPAQLTKVTTEKIMTEKYSEDVDKKLNIEVETKGEIINETEAKSIINIKVTNDMYYIEETKVGIYKFDEQIKDKEQVLLFLEVQGMRILWSYLREDIYAVSSKMLPNPIMLPTIDVLQTIEKAE